MARMIGMRGLPTMHMWGRTPACHAEIIVQHIPLKPLNPLGQVTECETHVQHLIIEREVADRHQIERGLLLPVLSTQPGAKCLQLIERRLAFPVGFERKFQFASGADARKAEVVGTSHAEDLQEGDVRKPQRGSEADTGQMTRGNPILRPATPGSDLRIRLPACNRSAS